MEYNFSNDKVGYAVKGKEEKISSHISLWYSKRYLVTNENGDSPLSLVAKLGYAFVQGVTKADKPGSGNIL